MQKYRFAIVALAVSAALTLASVVHADQYADTIEVYKQSETVQPFFESAYGYAVFPAVGKGGIGIGGAFGSKLYPQIEPLAALLARKAGRPVRLVTPLEDEMIAGLPRHMASAIPSPNPSARCRETTSSCPRARSW